MDAVFLVMAICILSNGYVNKTCISFHLKAPVDQRECEILTRPTFHPSRADISYRDSCILEADNGSYGIFFDAQNKSYKRYYSKPFIGNAPKSDEVALSYIAANRYNELFCNDNTRNHFKQLSCHAHAYDIVTHLFEYDHIVSAVAAERIKKLEAIGRSIDAGGPLVGLQSLSNIELIEEKYIDAIKDAEHRSQAKGMSKPEKQIIEPPN